MFGVSAVLLLTLKFLIHTALFIFHDNIPVLNAPRIRCLETSPIVLFPHMNPFAGVERSQTQARTRGRRLKWNEFVFLVIGYYLFFGICVLHFSGISGFCFCDLSLITYN